MIRRYVLAALAVFLVAGLAARPVMAETTAAPAAIVVPDMSIGNKDSKVTLMEYFSFTCPHCAQFHEDVYKQLKKDYIDTGKINFVLREFYRNKLDLWAGMMARCGGEMRYFGITDILLSTQSEWAASEDPTAVVAALKKIGLVAGMDAPTLDACMNNSEMAQAMVAAFQTNATADKVEGTPTLFINGTMHTNMAYEDLKTMLDAELAK